MDFEEFLKKAKEKKSGTSTKEKTETQQTKTKTQIQQNQVSKMQELINKAKNSAINKLALGKLIKPDMFVENYYDWYNKKLQKSIDVIQTLADKGIVPDIKDKNIFGLYEAGTTFWPKKIASAMMAFPRSLSAMTTELYRDNPFTVAERESGKPLTTAQRMEILRKQNEAEGKPAWLQFNTNLPEAMRVGWGAFWNKQGEYENYDWATALKKLESKNITETSEWAKDTNDWVKGTNWLQNIAGKMFGTPADIMGLGLDVATDPLSYISGGTGKGAKTGIRLTEDLVDETGRKVLSKGSMLALSPEGRTFVNKVVKNNIDEVIETIGKASAEKPLTRSFITRWFSEYSKNIAFRNTTIGKALIQSLKNAGRKVPEEILEKSTNLIDEKAITKLLKQIPMDSLKEVVISQIIKASIKDIVKNLPYEKAIEFIDRGGLKFAGMQLISGETLGKFQSKAVPWLEKIPGAKALEQMLWTGKGIPEEMRYAKSYLESFAKSRNRQFIEEAADVLSPLRDETFKDKWAKLFRLKSYVPNQSERKKLQNALEILKDISRYKEGLSTAAGKKLEFYQRQIPKLEQALDNLNITPKIGKVIEDYQARISRPLAEFEKRWGVASEKIIEPYYVPVRKATGGNLFDEFKRLWRSELGAEEAAYQRPIKTDWLQRQKQLESGTLQLSDLAGIEEATFKRIFESTQQVTRSRYLNDIKQFGIIGSKEGWIKATDRGGKAIEELKGWTFPKEIANPLKNVKAMFFTDDGFKSLVRGYDKLLTFWKRSALATPGYHMRNLMSDTWSGVMEYGVEFLNPVYWVDAQKISSAEKWLGARGFQLRSIKATAGEISDEFIDSGVRRASQYQTEAMTHGKATLMSLISPHEVSTRIGGWREDLGRTVAGLIEKRHGQISPKMVASQVKKVFLDYGDLTPTETNIGKRFVAPFYTWAKKNFFRQLELIATRTGKYAAIPKIQNYLEGITEKSEMFDEVKPDYWESSGIWTVPLKDSEGRQLGWQADLPFRDILSTDRGDLVDKLNPLWKYFIERGTNISTFTGGKIVTGTPKEAPAFMQPLAKLPNNILEKIGLQVGDNGVLKITERMQHNLQSALPLYYTLSRIFPKEEQYNTFFQRLSTGAGLKFYPFKEDEATKYYYQNFSNEVDEVIDALAALNLGKDETGEQEDYPNVTETTPFIRKLIKEKIGEEAYKEQGISKQGLGTLIELLKKYNIDITVEEIMEYLKQKNALGE